MGGLLQMRLLSTMNKGKRSLTSFVTLRRYVVCRLLAVLHQQYGQPDLLRSVQRKLPSDVLAHSAVPLVGRQAPPHLVISDVIAHLLLAAPC